MTEYKRTSERAFEFACGLIDEFRRRKPADDAERTIWWQLLDAGMSIGSNSSESGGAESQRDFVHKFHVALKEGRESLFWLRLLKHASPDRSVRIAALYKQCDEIVAILVSSLKTAKANEGRRTKNEELRTQNAEPRTQNEERRTKDAERKARDQSAKQVTEPDKRAKAFWYRVPDP